MIRCFKLIAVKLTRSYQCIFMMRMQANITTYIFAKIGVYEQGAILSVITDRCKIPVDIHTQLQLFLYFPNYCLFPCFPRLYPVSYTHLMHHVLTSSTHLQLIVIAYGSEDVQEQNALQALVQANGVNMEMCISDSYIDDIFNSKTHVFLPIPDKQIALIIIGLV